MKEINNALFLDLDGTILNNFKTNSFSKKDKLTLQKFSKNNYLIINTGRNYIQAKEVWDMLELDKINARFISANNGAEIYENNKLIKSNYLSADQLNEVFLFLKDKYKKIGFRLPSKKYYYSNYRKTKFVVEWFTSLKIKNLDEWNLDKDNYTKLGIVLMYASKKKNYKIFENLKKQFPDLNIFLTGHDRYIEIVNKNIDKGKVIEYFKEKVKFNKSLAAGDSGNDRLMFLKADISIAMSNTPKRIIEELEREKKEFILTDSVRNNGVSQALNKLDNYRND